MPFCCVTPGQHRSCDGVCPPTPKVCKSQKCTLSSGIEGEDVWDLNAPHGSDFYYEAPLGGRKGTVFSLQGPVAISLNALPLQLLMALSVLSPKLSQ